jgi:hypothetical protein
VRRPARQGLSSIALYDCRFFHVGSKGGVQIPHWLPDVTEDADVRDVAPYGIGKRIHQQNDTRH